MAERLAMKKAFILFVLVALVSVSLLGCRPTVSELEDRISELETALAEKEGEYEKLLAAYEAETGKAYEEESSDMDALLFDEDEVVENFNITKYSYQYSSYDKTVFAECFEIENTSTFNITISGEFHFFDEAGALVSVRTTRHEAIGPNQKTVLSYHQENPYSTCELKLSATLDKEHTSVASDFSYEVTEATDKLIVSLTNNGKYTAESVSALILYLNNGQVVGQSSLGYFDADHEFKPGKTIMREYPPAGVEFDSYKVYLRGQR